MTMKANEIDRLMKHSVSIFDKVDRMLMDVHFTKSINDSFPPHNIRKKGNSYLIEIAVAGYNKSEISISKEKEYLLVQGEKDIKEKDTLVYQGIAGRSFKKTFALGDRINVVGADLQDGMLYIGLEEVIPEEEKAKKIEIGNADINLAGFIS